jgi:sodium/hydrogen antiporter
MVPVALSLWGSGLMTPLVWFIGWFGPRGIASVLYLLTTAMEPGVFCFKRILPVITLTILVSIFLFRIAAVPFPGL